MEYSIGNKKQQLECNIEEEITPSQITLTYNPFYFEKMNIKQKPKSKNSDKNVPGKVNPKNRKSIPKKETKLKKNYLVLKCDKAYSGVTTFIASNINLMKFDKKFFTHFCSLITVDLSNNNLLKIPGDLFKLNYIKELNLEHNHINYIQHQLSLLTNLEKLILSHNEIIQLPNSLFKLTKLQILLINYNKIKIIPIEIGLMKSLEQLNIYNNQIAELPTTLCNISKLKSIEFEWIYILKKSFFLSDYKEMPDDDLIYEKCLKLFTTLYNKNILYCDQELFFNNFNIPKSLYNENIILNINNNNENKLQKKYFFTELIKHIKLKDIQNVYKYANLILSQKNYKEEDFLSKNKLTPLHFLFSTFNIIKLSTTTVQNKNLSNLTEKDSMIINENYKICSSRGNKISASNSKTNLNINKVEQDAIIAKSKIIGNYLFGILSNKIINNRSYDQWGPIHIAIRRGGFHCLEWIINKNNVMKEYYIQNNNNHSNNLDKSIKINNFSSINSLGNNNTIKRNQTIIQKKGFNLNLKGKEDWSPLHLSASLGLIDCVYLLLKNNAEVYSRNNNYKTPKQVTNILEINKLLTLYENYVLEEKYNNIEKDLNKKNKISPRKTNIPNQKSSQSYPSKTNINFFKEIFTNNEYSLSEIAEAMNNLTMSVINPINKNYINENILNKFFENTLNELDLFSTSIQNRKNLIIICGFNSIGISLNNICLMKLYQKLLSTPKLHLSKSIKLEMLSYIDYITMMNNIKKKVNIKKNTNDNNINKINSYNNKPKVNTKSKKNDKMNNIKYSTYEKNIMNKNKRKINIISLVNTKKNKNDITKKLERDESESSYTSSFIIDSDGNNSRNKCKNYVAKKAKIKEQGNTIMSSANESCNIQESSLSLSGIDAIGAGKIKYNK